MKRKTPDKPITKDELGLMLHKYINPLYEDMKEVKGELARLKKLEKEIDDIKSIQLKKIENEIDDIKSIQLRMENNLVDDNKLLHDRDDAHDKALKDHEKRIASLEDSL